MNFSAEEIFSQFGQYDRFVTLSFHFNSEAFRKYGNPLMGTFKYVLDERNELHNRLNQEEIPRTNEYIKFIPSELEELIEEQKTNLDKKGIQCKDIAAIAFVNLGKQDENRFLTKGKKEIQNTINIDFDPSGIDKDKMRLWLYNQRTRTGYELTPKEKTEYYGMLQHYDPERAEELKELLTNTDTRFIELPNNYYFLRSRYMRGIASDEEKTQLKKYINELHSNRMNIIIEEVKKSNERLEDAIQEYKDSILLMAREAISFEKDLILLYKLPIWWDFERFVHIYSRHVEETKYGDRNKEKTSFTYEFENIWRVIKIVCERVYKEAIKHFESSDSNFRRMGARSVYYDGVYYRIEIEKTGRLIAFHPYNES